MPLMSRLVAVTALLLVFAPAQAARGVTFEDLDGVHDAGGNLVTTLDLSNDGRYLAVAHGRSLQVVEVRTGRVLRELGEGQLPRWSPAGDQLAFYSVRSGSMQLWRWEAGEAQARQLTRFPRGVDPDPAARIAGYVIEAFDYAWSPDGTRVVLASRVGLPAHAAQPGEPLVLDGDTPPDLTLGGIFLRPAGATGGIAESPDGRQWRYRAPVPGERLVSRLFTVDARTGAVEMLDTRAGSLFHPRWSPDGRTIAFAAIAEGDDLLTASAAEIRLKDLSSGLEAAIAAGGAMKYRPRWSPDGRMIAYMEGGATSEADIVVVSLGQEGARRYPLHQRIRQYEWTRDGDGLLLSRADGERVRLERLRWADASPLLLSAQTDVGAWSQAATGMVVWVQDALGPDVWRLHDAAAQPTRLIRLASDRKAPSVLLGRTQAIPYRTAAGTALEGVVLYPPDYQPGRRYPLIVDVYPMSGGTDWMRPMSGNQAWAASGYLVFKPYARAPHAWTNCAGPADFCQASRGVQGWDTALADVMGGVDELIRLGLADPARMCVYGHSNGGGLAAYLITQTDRFRCAVVVAPVWPSWTGSPLLFTRNWQMMAQWTGVSVLDDPAAYVGLSAVFRAERVRTPVLLAVGDDDGMFLLGAIEQYNALRFAGKEVTLLRYPGQGHVFQGDGLRDLWQREMAYFDRHLKQDRRVAQASPSIPAGPK